MNVGFNQKTNKFTNEENLDAQMKEMEMKLIETKRMKVNGYPVLSIIGQAKNGNMMCAMYVAMLIETNTVFMAYVPPENNLNIGQTAWNKIISSLK